MRYWSMQQDGSIRCSWISADTLMYVVTLSTYMSTEFNRRCQQLDAMLSVILFQCRPDEAEIQRWYIERKQYDFVVCNRTNSNVVQLTRENDIWTTMESGTRIVMRAITEEVVIDSTVTATYKCPCGRLNTIHVDIGDVEAIWRRGCTITW
jgi:hypothetical protein